MNSMKSFRVGLIGWPVHHSLSPHMHNAAFRALDLPGHYDLIPTKPSDLAQTLQKLEEEGFCGINVTIPHKESILPLVRPAPEAAQIGAANTVLLPKRHAFNTDAWGFAWDLNTHGLVALDGQKVALLGAGGAARAALYILHLKKAHIFVVNRTPERAQKMVDEMQIPATVVDWKNLPCSRLSFIVNATSVGMWPNVDASPWPADLPFPQDAFVYDMVYRPQETLLLRQAQRQGCKTLSGLGMLLYQGAAAFHLWTGHEAPLSVMKSALEKAIQEAQAREGL